MGQSQPLFLIQSCTLRRESRREQGEDHYWEEVEDDGSVLYQIGKPALSVWNIDVEEQAVLVTALM